MSEKRLGANQFDVNALAGATFAVGAEDGSDTINVTIQLTDHNGDDMAVACAADLYLSSDDAGQAVPAAHSTSPAIGTDGLLQVMVTDLSWLGTFEADGDMDIDFLDTGTGTVYLNLVKPDGDIITSGAITHA